MLVAVRFILRRSAAAATVAATVGAALFHHDHQPILSENVSNEHELVIHLFMRMRVCIFGGRFFNCL